MKIHPLIGGAAAGFILGLALVPTAANAAMTVGDSIVVQYLFPNASTAFGAPVTTTYTGPGQVVVSSTNFAQVTLFNDSAVFTPTWPFFQLADFNGLALTNLSNSNAFSGWTLSSGMTGVSATILSNNRIGASWANRSLNNTLPATFTAPIPTNPGIPTTPAIPEPGTWAMMIAGFGLVGGVARRRQRPAVSLG